MPMFNCIAEIGRAIGAVDASDLREGDVIVGLPGKAWGSTLPVPASRIDTVDRTLDRRRLWIVSTDLASGYTDAAYSERYDRFVIARQPETINVGCGCCAPARSMSLDATFPGRCEWMHDDDETYAEVRHVHMSYESSDCDGRTSGGYTYTIPSIRREALVHWSYSDQYQPDFGDLWRYLVRNEIPGNGTLTVGVDDDGKAWATVSATTDEGGRGVELRACNEPWCIHDASNDRDHTAEAANY